MSPAYDVGYAYNPDGGWTATHQMSVNGKFDGIDRDDLLAFARAEGIKDAAETIDKVADSVSLWPRIAMDCGVPKEMVETIVKNMVLL